MWTPAALASEARPYARDIWRIVENQHRAATIVLTDSLDEQHLLEDILDRSKPKYPPDCVGLHYLLATPFRYRPYDRGSRFRCAHQHEGAYYAAERVETSVAEHAFYSLLFFAESPGTTLPKHPAERICFGVPCRTKAHIDLSQPPLDRDQAMWTHLTDYRLCQELGDAARAGAIEAIRYTSVRDPSHGANVALLSPKAFATKQPKSFQTWWLLVRSHLVQAWCEKPRMELEFPVAAFAADERLRSLLG